MLDSANVRVAVTGAVSYAPTDTPAPTAADEPLDQTIWRDVGYISEDGITEARERSTETIVAWQQADVVRTLVTEAEFTIAFGMIESNPHSIELFYGRPVGADGAVDIIPSATGGRRSIVVDYADGDHLMRLYLPQAELTEVGEQQLVSGEPVIHQVTLAAYPSPLGYSARKWHSALADIGS